jgi:N-acetylglucosamine-6-phosphate deacetylase
MKAFINGEIFDGEKTVTGMVLLVDDDRIINISKGPIPASAEIHDVAGDYLIPAFIDIQLYGGNGLLFAERPTVEAIQATLGYAMRGGATHILPTIATNSFEKIFDAIEAVRKYKSLGLPGVIGLHVEGPFINPAKKGAHVAEFIRKPTMQDAQEWMKRGEGIIRMITLAPEVCDDKVISFLQDHGVVVSAGHTNATYEEGIDAFSNGIKTATHLYNAMSSLQHRAPGMVGAVFNSSAMSSIVADGHHVDFAAIKIAKRMMNERLFLITDAVTENNEGYYQHRLQGDKFVLPDGTLSGSCLTMLKAVKNCIDYAEISREEAFRMGSLYPAKVMGLQNELGKLQKGYRAEFIRLNKSLDLTGVFTNRELTLV